MSLTDDHRDDRRPGETKAEYSHRMKQNAERRGQYAPGGYMSTRNADGSSRGGAAEVFEKYGFF